MGKIECPKCHSVKIETEVSFGGPAIYKKLKCADCGFKGGTSRVYEGEDERVEKEITERFRENAPDAVTMFVNSIVGTL